MSRVYCPRHPERTVFYRVYENRFERHFGHLRPIVQEVIEKYLDCGNPKHKNLTSGSALYGGCE